MAGAGVSGVAAACVAAGSVLIWTGLKGGSVLLTVQEIILGKQPSGTALHPINLPPAAVAGGQAAAGGAAAGGNAGGGGIRPTPGLNHTSPKGGSSGGGGGVIGILPDITGGAPQVAPPSLPVIPKGSPPPKPKWWPF